jgi:PAS domain S-box-containing protein
MAMIPALLPLGVSLAKLSRNASDDADVIIPTTQRGRAIINRLTRGGANAPITQWSEAKLEKAIRRNSLFRDYANELRLARVNALLSGPTSKAMEVAQASKSTSKEMEVAQADSIARVVDGRTAEEERQGSNVPDTLCEADLLLLAAEAKSEANPARDAALELLADNSFDALLITDAKGIIAYSNKAFTKLTGYDQADVIGKSPKLLQGPGTDKKVLARLKESMRQGDGDYEGSAINYRKNGTPFIMHWRVVPVKVVGEIVAWVAIQREGAQIPSEDLS